MRTPTHHPPTLRGAGRVRPRSADRPWRRWRAIVAAALAAASLIACQDAGGAGPTDAWTEAQLVQVLDLSELGRELTVDPSGDHLRLDGRALPPELLDRFPHLTMGRTTNLLRFADDALEAMSPTARDFVLRAAPAELRSHLAAYGLAFSDVRAAWGDEGAIDLVGLRVVASNLDRSGVTPAGAAAAAGARLLADLGVAR